MSESGIVASVPSRVEVTLVDLRQGPQLPLSTWKRSSNPIRGKDGLALSPFSERFCRRHVSLRNGCRMAFKVARGLKTKIGPRIWLLTTALKPTAFFIEQNQIIASSWLESQQEELLSRPKVANSVLGTTKRGTAKRLTLLLDYAKKCR